MPLSSAILIGVMAVVIGVALELWDPTKKRLP